MIKSMTGYGRRSGVCSGRTITVELRSVNHRFCEVLVRLPKTISALEEECKKTIQQSCQRGRIETSINIQDQPDHRKTVTVDRALARQFHKALTDLQRELKLSGTIDISMFTNVKDLISVTDHTSQIDKKIHPMVIRLLKGALTDLDKMRRREGAVLAKDIKQRIQTVRRSTDAIQKRKPIAVKSSHERIRKRIEQWVTEKGLESSKLYQELANIAERSDITEEITRLNSHFIQCTLALKKHEGAGKMLDFLLQEMNREVNTIGSKANDADISIQVVKIKGELEKIREQVQNIE